MRLRLSQLRRIIKEETKRALSEAGEFVPMSAEGLAEFDRNSMAVIAALLGKAPTMMNNQDDIEAFEALMDKFVPVGDVYTVGEVDGKPVVRVDVDGGQETFFYTAG